MGFGALIIGGFFMLIGWLVSSRLKSKFKQYSQVHLTKDLTGAEIARLMLADNKISDVKPLKSLTNLTFFRIGGNPIAPKTCPIKPESICNWESLPKP